MATASGSIRNVPFSSQYTSRSGLAGPTDPGVTEGTEEEVPKLGLGLGLGLGFRGSDLGDASRSLRDADDEEAAEPPRNRSICIVFSFPPFLSLFLWFLLSFRAFPFPLFSLL